MRCEIFDGTLDLIVGETPIAYIVFPISTSGQLKVSRNNESQVFTNQEIVALANCLRADDLIVDEPLDPQNILWIKDQLLDCEENCDHTPLPQYLPTRLLDVGVEGISEPRLVPATLLRDTTPSSTPIKYATLSYCWGSKEEAAQQLITTQSKFDSYCTRIPENQLTPVIKDAISVCRTIDIKYLWVDALCIIQRDIEDWDRESEMMGMVYCHSYLTIAPLCSSSCLDGFLKPRPPDATIYFQSTIHNHIKGSFWIYECHNDTEAKHGKGNIRIPHPRSRDESHSKWPKRGWTYQERKFASRLLLFGKSMLHFVCGSGSISESNFVVEGINALGGFRWLVPMAYSGERSEDDKRLVSDLWTTINMVNLSQYTYETDLLPSISGIAKACDAILEDTYLAGLWKRNLHYELGRYKPLSNIYYILLIFIATADLSIVCTLLPHNISHCHLIS